MVGDNSEKEIVGMIRGCIKTVTCSKKLTRNGKCKSKNEDTPKLAPIYTKLAYILGLRISPSHRYFHFSHFPLLFCWLQY